MSRRKKEFVPTLIDFGTCGSTYGVLRTRQKMFGIMNGKPYALRFANIIPMDKRVRDMLDAFSMFDNRLKQLVKHGPFPKENAIWLETYSKNISPFYRELEKVAEKACETMWGAASDVLYSQELAWNKIKIVNIGAPPDRVLRALGDLSGNEFFAFTKQGEYYKFALFHNAECFEPYEIIKGLPIEPWYWYDLEDDKEREIFGPLKRHAIMKELDKPLKENIAPHVIDSLYFRKLKDILRAADHSLLNSTDLEKDEVQSLSMTIEDFKGWCGGVMLKANAKNQIKLEKKEE